VVINFVCCPAAAACLVESCHNGIPAFLNTFMLSCLFAEGGDGTKEGGEGAADGSAGDAEAVLHAVHAAVDAEEVSCEDDAALLDRLGQLDLLLTWLWRVHGLDYYAGKELLLEADYEARSSKQRTIRGPRPEEGEEQDEDEGAWQADRVWCVQLGWWEADGVSQQALVVMLCCPVCVYHAAAVQQLVDPPGLASILLVDAINASFKELESLGVSPDHVPRIHPSNMAECCASFCPCPQPRLSLLS
jgi:hypothetical protein